ncbi:MAG: AzlD domain-containing protein [Gemmatirosa sp.]|nr:AzlD domain-containing protein [Gemmatirosa sp.]
MRGDVLLVVLGMAAVTLLTRVAGLWTGRGPLHGVLTGGLGARLLAALPGAVLVSIIAPAVVRGGAADAVAALASAGTFARTRNALASVVVGVGVAAVLRRASGA